MTNTITQTPDQEALSLLASIQDKIKHISVFLESTECPESSKQEIMNELKRISKITAKPVDAWETINKNIINVQGTFEKDGYKYYYKKVYSSNFDANKAKSTLIALKYKIDDFMKSSVSNTLKTEKIITLCKFSNSTSDQ